MCVTPCLLKRGRRVTSVHRWTAPLALYVWAAMYVQEGLLHTGEHTDTLRLSSHRHNGQGSTRLETSDVLTLILKPITSFDFQFRGRETDQAGL